MDAAPREIQARQPRARPRTAERRHPAVRGPAVERPARRRKQPLELRRPGDRPRRLADRQAAGGEPPAHRVVASGDLLRAQGGAGGRRVDEAEQGFRSGGRHAVVASILRADIDGGIARQAAGAEVGELGGVVGREEDVVAHEVEPGRPARHREGHGRERTVTGRHRIDRPGRARSEQPVGEGRHVGIRHHRVAGSRSPVASVTPVTRPPSTVMPVAAMP